MSRETMKTAKTFDLLKLSHALGAVNQALVEMSSSMRAHVIRRRRGESDKVVALRLAAQYIAGVNKRTARSLYVSKDDLRCVIDAVWPLIAVEEVTPYPVSKSFVDRLLEEDPELKFVVEMNAPTYHAVCGLAMAAMGKGEVTTFANLRCGKYDDDKTRGISMGVELSQRLEVTP